MRRRIAAFDFDGTLSKRDVLGEFLIRFAGPWTVLRSLVRHLPLAIGVVRGRASRDSFKAVLFADVFASRSEGALLEEGRRFAGRILRSRLRRDTLERLRWHTARGHETVLVSASLEAYLVPLAEAIGVDHVIAVRLEADAEGRLTGAMEGGNVRGPAKAELLSSWLGDDRAEIWAYGDSEGDRELLAMADHAVWVGRRGP